MAIGNEIKLGESYEIARIIVQNHYFRLRTVAHKKKGIPYKKTATSTKKTAVRILASALQISEYAAAHSTVSSCTSALDVLLGPLAMQHGLLAVPGHASIEEYHTGPQHAPMAPAVAITFSFPVQKSQRHLISVPNYAPFRIFQNQRQAKYETPRLANPPLVRH